MVSFRAVNSDDQLSPSRVWLIGGTSDSVAIAKILTANCIRFVVSVTTSTAQTLYSKNTEIVIGCMNLGKMQSFCQQQGIRTIVDASHPYAIEVSQSAIAIAAKLNIPYLRYERSNYQSATATINPLITELANLDLLLQGDYLRGKKVLLTIGCKNLPQFKSWQESSTLYARVLPKLKSLEMAIAAGFTSDRLIAIRPPCDLALEKALWQQWEISLVVTKASGKAGGEDRKRQVATELNIPLIIITRPKIVYPQKTSTLPEVLKFCQ